MADTFGNKAFSYINVHHIEASSFGCSIKRKDYVCSLSLVMLYYWVCYSPYKL